MADTERAVFTIHIDGTKEAVWNELTKTNEPQDALWHGVLHARGLDPGNPFQKRSRDGRTVSEVGEILEYDPPNRLKQTLRFTQYDDPYCVVTFEIADGPDGGVDFTLTVDDLTPGTKTTKGWTGSGGGDWVCKTLKEIIEDGKPSLFTRAMYRFWDIAGPLALPKKSRVEHWPMDDEKETK
ncbi:MAG: SRPBCC domain-containing protein [Acidimicrobiales bacterium]